MHEPLALFAIAAVLAGYALVSRMLPKTPISGPILFAAAGLLLGPTGIDLIRPGDLELIRAALEIALVLVLFSDAMTIQSSALRRQDFVPIRLLAIGLPLTMLLGWALAMGVLPGLEVWEALLLAVILAPTDAALGLATISDPRVPQLIRQSLNVESGLNDGMALPSSRWRSPPRPRGRPHSDRRDRDPRAGTAPIDGVGRGRRVGRGVAPRQVAGARVGR